MRYLGNHVEHRRLVILTHRKLCDVREITSLSCASTSFGIRQYYLGPTCAALHSYCEVNGDNQDGAEKHLESQREVGCSSSKPHGQQPSLTDLTLYSAVPLPSWFFNDRDSISPPFPFIPVAVCPVK